MKTNIIRILLIIVFTILFVHLFSQNYTTTHFNEKNGFNASTVYGINQDSKGFLWIGTDVGLIRYDGNEFKQYGLKDGLVDLEVINTSIDSRDNLILYNFSNQINYYQNGKFKNSKSLHKLSENDVNGHQIGAYNNLEDSFILSMYGSNCFYILKISIDSVETHKKIELAKNRKIISVTVFDDNYFVFFSENKNIKYVEIKDEKIIRKGFFKNQVGVFASNDNHIYSIYGRTLKLFKKNSDSLLELSQEIDLIHKSKHIFSNKNLIWVLLKKGGVLKIDAQGNKEFFNEEEIVNYGFQDRDSNFWIGTEGNGLYFYKKNQIQNFGIETLKKSKTISSLCSGNDNSIYLGFNKTTVAKFQNNSVSNIHNLGNSSESIPRKVIKIIHLKNDSLLCITEDNEYILNLKNNYSKEVTSNYFGTNKDALYLGSNKYMFAVTTILVKSNNGKIEQKKFKRTTSLKSDSKDNLWIGTTNGVFRCSNKTIEPIKIDIKELNKTKINDINFFKHFIVFSTDAGVYFYDSISSKIKNIITENKGLINNQCKKTITYNNSLWVATNSGLSKILFSENCEINTIVNFNISDGLISNFINDILIKNDTIYVATNEGLSVFPCNLKKNSYKPLINIIEAKTNLKPHNIYEPIKLTPKGNNISITYSNMLFSKSNESSYEFRLLPSTKKWTETNETSIAFSNLNPNSYTFEVRSAGINKIARVTFEVKPRFTQTLLFKFIIFLLLSSLTVLFFNKRMKLVRRKNFIEKTISQLELEAIKAQINPHFIYNSLNSIKNTIIKKENLIAEQQLSVFAKLVRQTLSISQKNFITLDKEIDYLNNYLEMEKMRFKENLTYTINLKNIDSSSEFVLPSMLLQPFIENSIKHGMPSDESLTAVITINFILKENILYCELKDNGPGVSNTSSDTNHISQGIKISSKRASTYNKLYNTNITVEIENKIENGTLINISIPQKNIQ